MSLINQVLKDLEARRGQAASTGDLRAAAPIRQPRAWSRWLIALAVSVALGATLFIAEKLLRDRGTPAPESRAPVAEPVPTPPVETIEQETQLTDEMDGAGEDDAEGSESPVEPEVEPDAVADTGPEAEPVSRTEPTPEATSKTTPEPPRAAVVEDPAPERPPATQQRTLRTDSPRQRADEAYGIGVRALTEGRRAEAERQFRAALGHDSSHHETRLALANLLAANGQAREAEVQLQQGLRIAPGETSLADRYARLLLDRGDLGGAIGVLSEAPPPLEAQPEYHALLAALLQRAGHHEKAADKYAALVNHAADRSMWWVGLAISLEELDRNAAALEAYRRAERDPRLSADVVRFVTTRIAALEGAVTDPAR